MPTTALPEKPTITITDAAVRVFRDAMAESEVGTAVVRLAIDPRFQHDLFFGPVESTDVVVEASGITLAMDASTARRANGLNIEYVDGPTGSGFKLENPNQTPLVRGIRPADLAYLREKGESLELVDARSEDERAKASVDGARPLDENYERELLAMPKTSKLVFMGHHSRGGVTAAQRFIERGFTDVWYVVGGIDAWSTMDPSVPRY